HAHDEKFIAALQPLVNSLTLTQMQHANFLADRENEKLSPEDIAASLDNEISGPGLQHTRK
ncbi:MAG TPA: hypothetical protein VGK90_02680, partial [Rhizomicrobium sp.]